MISASILIFVMTLEAADARRICTSQAKFYKYVATLYEDGLSQKQVIEIVFGNRKGENHSLAQLELAYNGIAWVYKRAYEYTPDEIYSFRYNICMSDLGYMPT